MHVGEVWDSNEFWNSNTIFATNSWNLTYRGV